MLFYESPIKIEFTDDGLFANNTKLDYSVRMLSQLSEALMKPIHPKEDKAMYLMYRDVFGMNNLRFDITIIASRVLGTEFARTYGHYHSEAEDGQMYPEIYQVLYGAAKFILQKENKDGSVDVLLISAEKGDVILFPPGYGHVSVNSSTKEPLFLSNLVSNNFKSNYDSYKKNRGPAIYCTTEGIVRNTNYLIRSVKKLSAKELNKRYGFVCEDLLVEFNSTPEKFEFLNKPSLFFRD